MNLEELINKINNRLENNIKLKNCKELIKQYDGKEWEDKLRYNSETYNRIKLYGNDLFEIIIICMNNHQESKIHNHAKNGCLMKVLRGNYIESIYCLKTKQKIYNKIRYTNKVSYIDDELGYHKLINPFSKKAVSIHIYSPPNHQTKYLS